MADTTDKPAAPAESTGTETTETPLTDKDLGGQAPESTGDSQDGSETSTAAPQEESGTEGTDDSATSDNEDGDSEGQLLTPEEIAKLPKELKAQYASIQRRYEQKVLELKRPPVAPAAPAAEVEPAEERPVFIDRAKLAQAKTQAELIDLIEEGMQKAADWVAGKKVGEAVGPIHAKEAAAEVKGYFEKFPDRAKYRVAMGKLDRDTQGRMTLDQLYYAASGNDRESAESERKDKKLRNLSKGNSESASGTSGKPAGGEDIFDEIAKAGGHGNSILR